MSKNTETRAVITRHSVVNISYRIVNEQGEVAEQSGIPIEYIHGIDNQMFAKVEQALEGKTAGETVEVSLPPEEGFGPHQLELTFTDDVENVPPEYRSVGARPTFQNADGETKEFIVSKIEDGKLTVDGNHLYAGQTVTFFVDVVGVRPATESELQNGVPAAPVSGILQ